MRNPEEEQKFVLLGIKSQSNKQNCNLNFFNMNICRMKNDIYNINYSVVIIFLEQTLDNNLVVFLNVLKCANILCLRRTPKHECLMFSEYLLKVVTAWIFNNLHTGNAHGNNLIFFTVFEKNYIKRITGLQTKCHILPECLSQDLILYILFSTEYYPLQIYSIVDLGEGSLTMIVCNDYCNHRK